MAERYVTVQFQFPDDIPAAEAIHALLQPAMAICEHYGVSIKAIITHTQSLVISIPMPEPLTAADELAVRIPSAPANPNDN